TITEPEVLVTQITVSSAGGVTEIETGETLQFSVQVFPEDASVKNISWSLENMTGEAVINQAGILTANSAGAVNVIATAMDGSGVEGKIQIVIVDPIFLVTQINVTSVGVVTEMFTNEILQFLVEVIPENANNKSIIWSVENQTGSGNIDQRGILTATTAGMVRVIASAQDGSGITGDMQITIIDPTILVTQIIVTSDRGVSEIFTGESFQFSAEVLPSNATNKEIDWSVENITGEAIIIQDGILTAVSEGIVDVVATAIDGSGVTGSQSILIKNKITPPDQTDTLIVSVYPNPGNGYFYLNVGNTEIKLIQVVRDNGLIIKELIPEPGKIIIPVDLTAFPLGNYVIKVYGEKMAVGRSIIIQ
ncbi:MAG: Ig-like domain-containing protein, partial [Candidatus Cloacimonetes bacterium]|nr:Ig-like domain-containing protein [Candidatus Cloacimonadota bacterium]